MRKFTTTALTAAFVTSVAFGALAQSMSPSSPADRSPGTQSMTPASPADTSPGTQSVAPAAGKVASASDVKSTLEASGYADIKSIQKSSDGWTASAMKDGKSFRVSIDDHGNIATQ